MSKAKEKEMDLRDKIEVLILETLQDLNLERETNKMIVITKDTAMLGYNTAIDSLEFLKFYYES